MVEDYKKQLLSYGLIRFVSLPAALLLTVIILIVLNSYDLFSAQTGVWILLIFAIIETTLWLLWLIKSLMASNKQERRRLGIANAIVILLFVGFATIGYNLIFGYELEMTEKSPCGRYTVEVYIPRLRYGMPGGAGIYSNPTKILLKNRWGWTVGRSDRKNPSLYGNLEFKWDYANNCFWYAKGECIEF